MTGRTFRMTTVEERCWGSGRLFRIRAKSLGTHLRSKALFLWLLWHMWGKPYIKLEKRKGAIGMMKLLKPVILFFTGAAAYGGIELLWRAFTGHLPGHWSMALLGGLMFLLIGAINEGLSWNMPLLLQSLIGAAAVTAAEFVAGLYLNLWLGLNIWDYTGLPLNLWGQICLPFSVIWVGLSVIAVILDDWLRHWLWKKERPHYTIFRWGKKNRRRREHHSRLS